MLKLVRDKPKRNLRMRAVTTTHSAWSIWPLIQLQTQIRSLSSNTNTILNTTLLIVTPTNSSEITQEKFPWWVKWVPPCCNSILKHRNYNNKVIKSKQTSYWSANIIFIIINMEYQFPPAPALFISNSRTHVIAIRVFSNLIFLLCQIKHYIFPVIKQMFSTRTQHLCPLLLNFNLFRFSMDGLLWIHWSQWQTRKSSCVNARGIPPAV